MNVRFSLPQQKPMSSTATGLIVFLSLTSSAFLGQHTHASDLKRCQARLQSKDSKAPSAMPLDPNQREALDVAPRFFDYFKVASEQILERDYVMLPMQLAWLAKEHILLVGPPGNAKTTMSKVLMANVKDAQTGKPSFFATQMTAETSLADTHGGINYRILNDTGRQERLYDEGALGSHFDLFDEQFDMRPNGYRNVLDILAERAHAQGNRQHVGKTWTVVGASNTFIPEVYAKFDGSDQPRALIDRYSFVIYVPAEMEKIESNRSIIKGSQKPFSPLPSLTFQDIEKLQTLVPMVDIPDHIADLLALIQFRMRPLFEITEQSSIHDYNEKIQNGEKPLPPYRSTKYMSPRTLGKAAGILKAIVVLEYLKNEGRRPLSANLQDLQQLELFYALGGPRDEFLNTQLQRASREVEKEQLKNLVMERKLVRETFKKTIDEFQQTLSNLPLRDFYAQVNNYGHLNRQQRNLLMDNLAQLYQDSLRFQWGDQLQHSPELIAKSSVSEIIESWVKKIEPQGSENILAQWKKNEGHTERKLRGRYTYGPRKNRESNEGFQALLKVENRVLKSQARQQNKERLAPLNIIEPRGRGLLEIPLKMTKDLAFILNHNSDLFASAPVDGLYLQDEIDFTYSYFDETGLARRIPQDSYTIGQDKIVMGPFLKNISEKFAVQVPPYYQMLKDPQRFRTPKKNRYQEVMIHHNDTLFGFSKRRTPAQDFVLPLREPMPESGPMPWLPLIDQNAYTRKEPLFTNNGNYQVIYDYFNLDHLSVYREQALTEPEPYLVIFDHKNHQIYRRHDLLPLTAKTHVFWYTSKDELKGLSYSLTKKEGQDQALLFKDQHSKDQLWLPLAGIKKNLDTESVLESKQIKVWLEDHQYLHIVFPIANPNPFGSLRVDQVYEAVYKFNPELPSNPLPELLHDSIIDLPTPLSREALHLELSHKNTLYLFGSDSEQKSRLYLIPPQQQGSSMESKVLIEAP